MSICYMVDLVLNLGNKTLNKKNPETHTLVELDSRGNTF